MHLVIPVTMATAMAADVMRQRCFSVRRGPRRQIVRIVEIGGGSLYKRIDSLHLFVLWLNCTYTDDLSISPSLHG